MSDASYLPPIPDIRDRLARNQRERRGLRTLLRWAIDDNTEERPTTPSTGAVEAGRLPRHAGGGDPQ